MPFSVELAVIGGIVGLVVGSFLNVVISRIPQGERPWSPSRSYCPSCRASIRWHDNIPLVSYALLRGKCRDYSAKISPRYPFVELATGALFAWAWWTFGAYSVGASKSVVFGIALLTLAVIDWETFRLPNVLVGIGAVCAVLIAGHKMGVAKEIDPMAHSLMSGAVGFGILWTVRFVGSKVARREAMGLGDVKFFGMIGLFLADLQLIVLAIGFSSMIGAIVGSFFLQKRRSEGGAIPFGPFLALGGWITYVWGERLLGWYIGWIGG
ncbi:MAG: prepilin peptidase [Candidatus Poribacteria bacterium]|nr:prepilin peptidase [Candidatus Poribacteria bacterium]